MKFKKMLSCFVAFVLICCNLVLSTCSAKLPSSYPVFKFDLELDNNVAPYPWCYILMYNQSSNDYELYIIFNDYEFYNETSLSCYYSSSSSSFLIDRKKLTNLSAVKIYEVLFKTKDKSSIPPVWSGCEIYSQNINTIPFRFSYDDDYPCTNSKHYEIVASNRDIIFNQSNVIFYPVISAPFVRFCNDLHPLHVLKPCKNRAETVHLLPDKLKSTSSDNDLTALVWVAILLFLVLAASQADWKASDLILSITRRFVLEKSNTARYGLYGLVVVSFCQQENNIKRKEKQMMKRIFTLITSIVLATSLLAVPCFAAEPEDLPTPQPGVTETEQPDGSDQPENPDRPSIQACDAMPGVGDMG